MRGKYAARAAHRLAEHNTTELLRAETAWAQERSALTQEIGSLQARITELEGRILKEASDLADGRVQAALAYARESVEQERARITEALVRAFSALLVPATEEGLSALGNAARELSRWVSAETLFGITGSRTDRRAAKKTLRSQGAIRASIAADQQVANSLKKSKGHTVGLPIWGNS
jgi:chromosome segregation ATPase